MTFNKYQDLICNYIIKTYKASVAVEDNYIIIHIIPYNMFIKFDIHDAYGENIERIALSGRKVEDYELQWILENSVDRLITENIIKGAKNE